MQLTSATTTIFVGYLITLTSLATSTNLNELNDVVLVDLKVRENVQRHRTLQYRQNDYVSPYNPFGPSIVLRRGELFNLVIHLKQAYNETTDRIRLEFGIGYKPQLDKDTLKYLPVDTNLSNFTDKSIWEARVEKIIGNQLFVQVNLPSNAPIGIWRLKISSKIAGTKTLRTFLVNPVIYLIFNAWSPDDAVYLGREDARQEYVLNEVGKIYIGSNTRPWGRKWTYGQFHDSVLPGIMFLLDRTRLDVRGRADVVKVSRAVSAIVNSHDENGLLVGNWSGNYGDGLAPWQWTGSALIFDKYLQSGGRPVKFGQCWVFGGVTTTALRSLGIPARTISNFVSAHDTDLSLTVDKFYSERGHEMKGVNGDSIWNFHVWSDAWMARSDLPPGYGGWQAIDATPQEVSMGAYQLGPASLQAIKNGKVNFAYDVGFVYSEVNADYVYWRLEGRYPKWRKTTVQKNHVGRKMLTKVIGFIDLRSRYEVDDAEDIVSQYKFPEGSREERLVYLEATRLAGLNTILDKR